GQSRRLSGLPHAAWLDQPEIADAQHRQVPLSRMPLEHAGHSRHEWNRRRDWYAVVPRHQQPAIRQLHRMPLSHSQLEQTSILPLKERRLKMKNIHQSIIERLSRTLAGAVTWALLLSFGVITFAQSSVEKGETSQQAREPESELERARAIVAKPGENKPAKPE